MLGGGILLEYFNDGQVPGAPLEELETGALPQASMRSVIDHEPNARR